MNKSDFLDGLEQVTAFESKALEFFSEKPRWRCFPFEDHTDDHWFITEGKDRVAWSPEPFTMESIEAGSDIYSGEFYLNGGEASRRDGLVLMLIDTRSDGNVFWMVFDEAFECKDAALIEEHGLRW